MLHNDQGLRESSRRGREAMPKKYEKIQDPAVREMMIRAESEIQGGNASQAVHTISDAFLTLIEKKPELLKLNLPADNLIHHRQYPRMGANLMEVDGKPVVHFDRERFSTADA